jgi:uncharacterized protein (DUF3820 family)
MSKSFSNIKKSLGLLDIIQFGKYKGCRVDSLIEHDDDYLRYMQTQGIKFDAGVMDALMNKFSATSIAVNKADDDSYEDTYEESDRFVSQRFDDMPF